MASCEIIKLIIVIITPYYISYLRGLLIFLELMIVSHDCEVYFMTTHLANLSNFLLERLFSNIEESAAALVSGVATREGVKGVAVVLLEEFGIIRAV